MKKLHLFIIFTSLVSSLSCVGSDTTQASNTRFLTKTKPVSGIVLVPFAPIRPESPKDTHPVSPIGPDACGVSPVGSPTPPPTRK